MPDTTPQRLRVIQRCHQHSRSWHGGPEVTTDLLAMIGERDAENAKLLEIILKQSALLASRCAGCGATITEEMRLRPDIAPAMVFAESGRVWCWGCVLIHRPEPCHCGLVHDLGPACPPVTEPREFYVGSNGQEIEVQR